jgi:hypothetical protein
VFDQCCVEPEPVHETCTGSRLGCNRITGVAYRTGDTKERLHTIPEEFNDLKYLEVLNLADRNLQRQGSNLKPRNMNEVVRMEDPKCSDEKCDQVPKPLKVPDGVCVGTCQEEHDPLSPAYGVCVQACEMVDDADRHATKHAQECTYAACFAEDPSDCTYAHSPNQELPGGLYFEGVYNSASDEYVYIPASGEYVYIPPFAEEECTHTLDYRKYELAVGSFGFSNFDRLWSIRFDTSQNNGNMQGARTISHHTCHAARI